MRELRATPLSANAYLGAWGIVEALNQGADIVVCPRVTDASVVVGPAAWHFGWQRNDWDQLAGAVAAGHVVECGAQCTGGNYAFFQEVPGLEHPGFPIAEMHEDGSSVITKHAGTGGLVSVGTVTAQLLYEIDKPSYINPDVVARFDTIRLDAGRSRSGAHFGRARRAAPSTVKVCLNYLGGYRNQMTFVLTGLGHRAESRIGRANCCAECWTSSRFDALSIRSGADRQARRGDESRSFGAAQGNRQEPRFATRRSGIFRGRSSRWRWPAIPVFFHDAAHRRQPFGVYWPTLVPADIPQHVVVLEDGTRVAVPPTAPMRHHAHVSASHAEVSGVATGPTL